MLGQLAHKSNSIQKRSKFKEMDLSLPWKMIKWGDRSVSFFLCQPWIQCLKRGHMYCQVLVFENHSSFHRNSLDPFKRNISKTLKWQRKPMLEPSNVVVQWCSLWLHWAHLSTMLFAKSYMPVSWSRSTEKNNWFQNNVIRQMLGKH